ncbi:G-protein coupled receptor Mth2, partial [Habropoda laboriosa]
ISQQNNTIEAEKYENLPVVGKCCALNEVFVKNGTPAVCSTSNSSIAGTFLPLFHGFNSSGYEVPGDKESVFVAITGNPCEYKYKLDPDENSEDDNYLLLNGSVYVPHHNPVMLQPGVDYCMEFTEGLGLETFVCFPKGFKMMVADSRITIFTSGLLISVPFFILTIVTYSITPKLRDVFGKALCRYCGCLALAFTMLATTQLWSVHLSDQACTSIAFVIQFSFVACFFWLNVMCIEMWLLVRSHVDRDTYTRMKPKTLFFWYSLWCWGPSVIFILVSMIMDLSPAIPATYVKQNFGKESCWFRSVNESMPYFYVPVGLLLVGNVILFTLTFCKLTKYQKDLDLRRLARNEESDQQDRKFLRRLMRSTIVCLIIFFLMALNWTMELISWFMNRDIVDWPSFDFINVLQGVIVFGLFVLQKPPRDYVWHRIQQIRGINVPEPEVGSMELYLLPMMNGNSTPRQTIIP